MSKSPLALKQGRPRMQPWNVFLFYLLCGYQNGICSRMAQVLIQESESLRALLHPSTQHLPKATTILENINLIDKVASKMILKEQLRWLASEDKTQEWEQITVDSSALHANASYPQDSALIVENLDALVRDFVRTQEALGLENTLSVKVDRWVTQVHQSHKQISLSCRKRRAKQIRRKYYRRLILSAIKVMKCLQIDELKNMESRIQKSLDLSFGQARIYDKHQGQYRLHFNALVQILSQSDLRVLLKQQIQSTEKILSMKDPDAAIISKGGREPVFGYKVQMAFNKAGYCTACVLNKGNASDSRSLKSVVRQNNAFTAIKASILSVDDGYAGAQTQSEMQALGIKTFSVSGSKGKRQLGEPLYQSEPIRKLRNWRSAAESRIFTFKHNHQARKLRRHSFHNVGCELFNKVFAYNLCHYLRRKQKHATAQPQTA